ncbi:MAG TPA: dienelactone hydrolase family protein [Gemmatimonadales bacterium]|nr:dienelactone hydrolase family protein [Gemmatimonadales bacterium]
MINGGTYEFSDQGVHAGQGVLQGGTPLEEASVVLVLAHGRGASADDMIGLGRALYEPGVAVLAPQASGSVWYPERFLAPIERNEPWLSSALGRIDAVVRQALDAGIPTSGIIVGGFSQGACLATEYAARQAGLRGPLGGVLGFSGGLIGPPGTDFTYPGSLEGMPVFLGCSDVDQHIPKERVQETANALGALGAEVEMVLYPGMGHTINDDELERARKIVRR